MKCHFCAEELRWNNDYDTEDVGDEDSEHLIVSMYECTNEKCKAWYEIYHGLKNTETIN
jgi:hypothetical protein